jgi:type II secretory pathway component PulF
MAATGEMPSQPDRSEWLLLAYGVSLVALVSGHLFWLLWSYVPWYASEFAGMGIELPRSTMVAVAASMWFIRLLPYLVVLVVLVGVVLARSPLAEAMRTPRRMARALTTIALVAGLAEAVACASIVHAVHAAYSAVAGHARLERSQR